MTVRSLITIIYSYYWLPIGDSRNWNEPHEIEAFGIKLWGRPGVVAWPAARGDISGYREALLLNNYKNSWNI